MKLCADCAKRIKSTSTRCRVCANRAQNSTPAHRAKISAGLKALFANNPEHRARLVATAAAASASRDPIKMRAWSADNGRKAAQTRMAWCPLEYRTDYLALVRKALGPGEARRLIVEQIAADTRAYHRTGKLQQAVRAA